ncbi:protein GET1 isoform X2 [Malania oleifera]|uniref:protein GET1 isoform X2 n=1 Tax=Malania oleifera TaxID=397392 RepID=UPI0025AE4BC4|nr:protein GET1 isoform X2 [Malania oleifera]
MGEETLKPRTSLAAPIIFFLVVLFQFLSKYLENMKKRGSKSPMEIQLRAEIKQLLKEANSLSEPSTFAQAAKLRRTAAAKEKEMENYKGLNGKENNLSFDSYLKVLTAVKARCYLGRLEVHSMTKLWLGLSLGWYYLPESANIFVGKSSSRSLRI